MIVTQYAPGLWRWTAPHPAWKPENGKPDGWGQMVGCVYYEPGDAAELSHENRALILIEPLVPALSGEPGDSEGSDTGRFWRALDRDVDRAGLPIAILIGNEYHGRSSAAIVERYRPKTGVSVYADERAARDLAFPPTHFITPGPPLPSGVRAIPIDIVSNSETAFFIPEHRALIVSDALVGTGGGKVAVVPVSWAPHTPEGEARYHRDFRATLSTLLDLPFELLLTSHGEPVTENARGALETALASPPLGSPGAPGELCE